MPSEGPLSGGTFESVASTGDASWGTPSNASASDDTRSLASASTPPFATTEYHKSTNFGFAIPGGSTIDGIVVEVERKSFFAGTLIPTDDRVRIVKGGTIGSTDKSGGAWPSADAYATYGSSSDLWGETWTDTDINASDFGFAIGAVGDADGIAAQIDHVRITVYYTSAAGTSVAWLVA